MLRKLYLLLFLSFSTTLLAQKPVNWAVAVNSTLSGVNYYAPRNAYLNYYYWKPIAGYSAILDMSRPLANSKSFSWYANLAYLRTGFQAREYIQAVEREVLIDDTFSTIEYRQEAWSKIRFHHLALGGFLGFKREKINVQLGGKILYLLQASDYRRTMFLSMIQTVNTAESPERFKDNEQFLKWDIGPQMNIEILLAARFHLNTSFYYGSGNILKKYLVDNLDKRFYLELGLKYYFFTY